VTANRSTAATWPPVSTTMVIAWPDAAWNGTVSDSGRPGRRPTAVTAYRAAGAESADLGPQALIHADAHGSIPARPG